MGSGAEKQQRRSKEEALDNDPARRSDQLLALLHIHGCICVIRFFKRPARSRLIRKAGKISITYRCRGRPRIRHGEEMRVALANLSLPRCLSNCSSAAHEPSWARGSARIRSKQTACIHSFAALRAVSQCKHILHRPAQLQMDF